MGTADIEIRANEILGGESGKLDRCLGERGIWTAGDKLVVMQQLVEKSTEMGVKPKTVYIGDSPTDLACLLEADVGICIRDQLLSSEQKGLKETLERVGVASEHVSEYGMRDGGLEEGEGMRLWWAADFDEVCESGILGAESSFGTTCAVMLG